MSAKCRVFFVCVLLNIFCVLPCVRANDASPIPISFESNGYKIAGLFFKADVEVPSPSVILLPPNPSEEGDVLNLGQNLSKADINVFTFSYRGTWKSEGIFLPSTSLEDVKSAFRFLKSSSMITNFHIDTTRISVVGYSYGGGMALLGSVSDPSIMKVVSIAGGNLRVIADQLENNQEYRTMVRNAIDEVMKDSTAMRGLSGEATQEWLMNNREEFDILKHTDELSHKKILLIGGWQDKSASLEDHLLPLLRALRESSTENSKIIVYDCGHDFGGVENQLAEVIIDWINNH